MTMSVLKESFSNHDIFVGDALPLLSSFIESNNYSNIVIVVDKNTKKHCLSKLQDFIPQAKKKKIIEISSGERSKTIITATYAWKMLADIRADRDILLVNLGGGVVTDLGGMVASTYKRGIDFVQVPTTLLAQVDASIGGKTGVNLNGIKNMIGTFSYPRGVFIDPSFLETLPMREWLAGFSEMIKHGLILDSRYYEMLKETKGDKVTPDMIFRSVELKSRIVEEDPYERGDKRKALNYGHTIGHAIESLFYDSEAYLLHGEAVAIGMICEAYLSHKLLGLSKEELYDITSYLTKLFKKRTLSKEIESDILHLMENDKKSIKNKEQFSLLSQIGSYKVNCVCDKKLVLESLDYYRSSF